MRDEAACDWNRRVRAAAAQRERAAVVGNTADRRAVVARAQRDGSVDSRVGQPRDVRERVDHDVALVGGLRGLVDVLPVAAAAPGRHHRARWHHSLGRGVEHVEGRGVHEARLFTGDAREQPFPGERTGDERAAPVGQPAQGTAAGDHTLGPRLDDRLGHGFVVVSNRSPKKAST